MSMEVDRIAVDLKPIIKGDVFTDIINRAAFSTDGSIYQVLPACVVAPRDTDDIVNVVKYASANNLPIAPRGAASGLAGESLCSGIVLDCKRYMNNIISVAQDGSSVVCQPGVVLDELNECLARFGRKIGPDPSSANRATVGGCVANNSTGSHSLEYGYIADHVVSIEAVLADGKLGTFRNNFDPNKTEGLECSIAKNCLALLAGKEEIIKTALPKSKRNRSGYNISGICHDGKIDLARLLAASEGTLGIFTQIELKTVVIPKAKGLVQFEFNTFEKMAAAVPVIVQSGVSACEFMDKILIDLARKAFPEYRDILPADTTAILLVEHTGQDQQQVREKIAKTDAAVGALADGRRTFFDIDQQKRLWKSRKDSLPLLGRNTGAARPVAFIEDASVEHTKLGQYISGCEKIFAKYNIQASFYGHAGDGQLHVRPYLDLSDPADVAKMREIADQVFPLVWSLGGSISGEHADGLVHSAFVKQQFGPQYYDLLKGIKNIFDPSGIMNPGKIINSDPDVMIKNLQASHKFFQDRLKSDLHFAGNELSRELAQCNGCGLCLSRANDVRMCPVYRAMGQELGSSRAKVNLVRFWATGQLDNAEMESKRFREFLDLCVNCKACTLECPSGVDVSKIVMACRGEYIKRKGLRLTEFLLGRNRYLSMMGTAFWPISNFVMSLGIFKWFLEKLTGLDKRRNMPQFASGTFLSKGQKYLDKCAAIENPVDKVVYFTDTYVNYNDHQLGFAVINVLRHNNIDVVLAKQIPSPLPAVVYGDVTTARKDLDFNIKELAQWVKKGYKIICSEPSAALCIKDESQYFLTGGDAKLVSENTVELMSFLLNLQKAGNLKAVCKPVNGHFAYHLPCHMRAAAKSSAGSELLKLLMPMGLQIEDLKAGCCGLAGTFGMQKKNYPLSEKISQNLKTAIELKGLGKVLTECSACKMQIEHISNVKAVHPVKILAESYGF